MFTTFQNKSSIEELLRWCHLASDSRSSLQNVVGIHLLHVSYNHTEVECLLEYEPTLAGIHILNRHNTMTEISPVIYSGNDKTTWQLILHVVGIVICSFYFTLGQY